ncbi:hypothetical protein RNZ50_12785 [Paracoccaceae bacterium Fryx2]|nr:hypothetical protein [Paracoccaceae bacterium Fryx2]
MTETPPVPVQAKPRRAPRRGRSGLWLLLSLVFMAFALVFGVMGLTGKPLRLPVWTVVELESRVNRALGPGMGGAALSMGAIEVTVGRDWVPRFRLEDLRLARPGAEALLTLPEVRVAIDAGALLSGQVRARSLTLVGARLKLRRDADGRIDLGSGGNLSFAHLDSFAAVLDAAEEVVALPVFSHLRRIEAEALTLTLEDQRARRVWEVGDGRLTILNRDTELAAELGLSLVGGGQAPAQALLTFVTAKGSAAARITATVDRVAAADIAAQAGVLEWLGVLDAPISGRLSTTLDAGGRLTGFDGALTVAAGALRPRAETAPIAFEQAGMTFGFDPAAGRIILSDLTVQSRSLRLAATGHAYLPDAVRGNPDAWLGQMRLTQVMVDPDGLFVEPLRFSEGAVDVRLKLDPFSLDIGQVALVEAGRHLIGKGRVSADPEGWRLSLDLGLDAIRHDRLLALWPMALVPRTRAWLVENLTEGELFDVQAAIRLSPGAEPRLSLGYEFKEVDVRVLKTLPPVQKASGYSTIEGNAYTMVVEQGQVIPPLGGPIDVAGSVFSVPDITQLPAQAVIRLLTDSSVTAALSLLDEPPFRFMTKAGRSVEMGQGRAVLETVLRLPLAKKVMSADVDFRVTGTLHDLTSDALVPGRVLTAAAMTLTADPAALRIAGPGRLGKVPFDVTYDQSLGPEAQGRAQVAGTVTLSQAAAADFGLGLPDGTISGEGPAAIAIDLQRGTQGKLLLTSDLAGIGLRLPDLGWSKSPTQTGRLELEATLALPPPSTG